MLKKVFVIGLIMLINNCARQAQPLVNLPVTTKTKQKRAPIKQDLDIVLVLGGGGAKAAAHIGAIEALEENGIKVDLIVGTSAGSIIGALYADTLNAKLLKDKMLKVKRSDLLDFSITSFIHSGYSLVGTVDGKMVESFIARHIKAKTFEDLKIPLIAVATDVNSGNVIALQSGGLGPAVRASSALPGLFSPVKLYNMTLVDGGVAAPLPVNVAKHYNPKVIIAVDISSSIDMGEVNNMFELIYKSMNITYYHLNSLMGKDADILIKPELKGATMFGEGKNIELYNAGKKAMQLQIKNIKEKLSQKRSLKAKILKKVFNK